MNMIFGLWADFKVHQFNRMLRPYNVRLVLKTSREWGEKVSITAVAIPVVNVVALRAPATMGPTLSEERELTAPSRVPE